MKLVSSEYEILNTNIMFRLIILVLLVYQNKWLFVSGDERRYFLLDDGYGLSVKEEIPIKYIFLDMKLIGNDLAVVKPCFFKLL